jgi:hypothetical protein
MNSQLTKDRAGPASFQYIRENDVNGSSEREIFSAYFVPHLVALEFENHFLTIGEIGQTSPLDGAHMNEYVAPAVVAETGLNAVRCSDNNNALANYAAGSSSVVEAKANNARTEAEKSEIVKIAAQGASYT